MHHSLLRCLTVAGSDLIMTRRRRRSNPAIAPPPMLRFAKQQSGGGPPRLRVAKQRPGVGGTVVQQLMGGAACLPAGRDVAPLGADVRVSRALPVGLHDSWRWAWVLCC